MVEITVREVEKEDSLLGSIEEAVEGAVQTIERSLETQSEFADELFDRLGSGLQGVEEGPEIVAGFASAQEVYFEAMEETFEMTAESYEDGKAPDLLEVGDIWIDAANEATKEVMRTSGFAAATGGATETSLEAKAEFEENRNETLRGMGIATEESVAEVGERLVELERRQHEVESKIDRLLEEEN
jgi:hypothetical protein